MKMYQGYCVKRLPVSAAFLRCCLSQLTGKTVKTDGATILNLQFFLLRNIKRILVKSVLVCVEIVLLHFPSLWNNKKIILFKMRVLDKKYFFELDFMLQCHPLVKTMLLWLIHACVRNP